MTPSKSIATRRALLGAAGGGGLALLAKPAGAHSVDTRLDLTEPGQRLRALAMIRGALDDRLAISCITCDYYGSVDARLTPFYKLVAATFARWRRTAAGGYEGVSYEIEYFIDPATNGILNTWRNPYTGETVIAQHTDTKPARFTMDANGKLAIPPSLITPGSVLTQEQRPFEVIGDDVWRVERSMATVPAPGGEPLHFDETVTWHARASDLSAPGQVQVRSDTHYLGISSFRPWQKMGGHPGEMIGMGHGLGGLAIEDLPPVWVAATKVHHPQFLANPGAALAPIWEAL